MNEIVISILENSPENEEILIGQIRRLTEELQMNCLIRTCPADPEPFCTDRKSAAESFLWVSNRNGHFRLYHSKCRFIETENRCLIFHYGGRTIRQSGKISDIIEKLPEHIFFRCNNSYIVNLNYIDSITPEGDRYNIGLMTGEILPLSRSRYHECLLRLGKY